MHPANPVSADSAGAGRPTRPRADSAGFRKPRPRVQPRARPPGPSSRKWGGRARDVGGKGRRPKVKRRQQARGSPGKVRAPGLGVANGRRGAEGTAQGRPSEPRSRSSARRGPQAALRPRTLGPALRLATPPSAPLVSRCLRRRATPARRRAEP